MQEPNILLTPELRSKVVQYINKDSGYSYKTKKVYSGYINNLFNKYPVPNNYLNRERLRKIYNQKNPNRRAIYSLLYKVNDEYSLNLPIIKINPLKREHRKPPSHIYDIRKVKEIISLLPDENSKLFFKLIYNSGSGLRVSEVITLDWNQIDWINWLKDKTNQGSISFKSKGGKYNAVPIPPYLMNLLLEKAKREKVEMGKIVLDGMRYSYYPKSRDFVFSFEIKEKEILTKEKIKKDDELRYKYLRRVYDKIRNNWIIPYINKHLDHHFKIHSLRHSRSIQLLREGVPLAVISNLLGHERIETTMIYLNIDSSQKAKYLKNVENLI